VSNMTFFFKPFPKTNYDIKKNGKIEVVTNIMLRFKITEELKKQKANYFEINVQDGDRPDVVASKIYDDPELDWVILMINNIVDPFYDWPMSSSNLEKYVRDKYGSIANAQATVHEYRKILNEQSVLFDGTVIPKRTLIVDETTYNSLSEPDRESIDKYQYESELNDSKRQIKIVDPQQLSKILNSIEDIFE
jgi:hypothetical protein